MTARVRYLSAWVVLSLVGCYELPLTPNVIALRFVTQPTYAIAKGDIKPAVAVALQDEQGRTVTAFSGAVTLTLVGSDPSAAVLSGTTTATAVNGVATFPDLSIDGVGTGYALRASAPGQVDGTSRAFKVTPLLVFTGQPGDAAAGTAMAPAIQVSATDATGALLSTFSDSVTVAIGAGAGLATLFGATTVAAVRGVATFPDLSINLGATGYTLTAAYAGISLATSAPFDVSCISNCWIVKSPMPGSPARTAVVVMNDVLYAVTAGATYLQYNGHYAVTPGATQVYDPVADRWTARAPLTGVEPDVPLGGVAINGTLYVVYGGSDLNVQAYDPLTDTWTFRRPLQAFLYGINGFGVSAANGIIYAMGGEDLSGGDEAADAYDPVTDRWSTALPAVPTMTIGPGAGVLNGVMYLVGGSRPDLLSPLDAVQAYDPATTAWASRAPMPTPRSDPAVAVLNGLLYVIGGRASNGQAVGAVEAYDATADRWTAKASLPTPRWGLGVGVVNGVLYAVGGVNSGGLVEAYRP